MHRNAHHMLIKMIGVGIDEADGFSALGLLSSSLGRIDQAGVLKYYR